MHPSDGPRADPGTRRAERPDWEEGDPVVEVKVPPPPPDPYPVTAPVAPADNGGAAEVDGWSAEGTKQLASQSPAPLRLEGARVPEARLLLVEAAFGLCCLLLFTIPLLASITWPSFGTASKAVGFALALVATPAVMLHGRTRRLEDVHILLILFTAWALVSWIWSVDLSLSEAQAFTVVQLLVMVLCLWEFGGGEHKRLRLLGAYTAGAFLSAALLVLEAARGGDVAMRYSLAEAGPNGVAFALCLAIPMSWYLSFKVRSLVAIVALRSYIPLALMAMVVTASRSALFVAGIAILVVPLSLPLLSRAARTAIVAGAVICLACIAFLIPAQPLARLATTGSELQQGDLGGRNALWRAGLEIFGKEPVLGVGIGASRVEIERRTGALEGAHNTFISLAAEVGFVGLALFSLLLVTIVLRILRTKGLRRTFCLVLFLTLLVGLVPRHWEYEKATWAVLALLVNETAVLTARPLPATRHSLEQLVGTRKE